MRGEILALLLRLRRELGLAALVITHDLGLAWTIADRVAVMYRGELVEQGTVEQVLLAPTHDYTRTLLAAVPHDQRSTRPNWTNSPQCSGRRVPSARSSSGFAASAGLAAPLMSENQGREASVSTRPGADGGDERAGGGVDVAAFGGHRAHGGDLADLGRDVDPVRPAPVGRRPVEHGVAPGEHRGVDLVEGPCGEVPVQAPGQVAQGAERAGDDQQRAAWPASVAGTGTPSR